MKRSERYGKIAVSPRIKTLQSSNLDIIRGTGQIYIDCQTERSTENNALSNLRDVPTLTALHQEIALLERIGLNPLFMPDHPVWDRPARPIYGKALWGWISRQPGITMSATEVAAWLKQIQRIMEETEN